MIIITAAFFVYLFFMHSFLSCYYYFFYTKKFMSAMDLKFMVVITITILVAAVFQLYILFSLQDFI
jgi:hypothetical protein